MSQLSLYQVGLLLAAFILAIVSLYIPLSYLHKQLFWTETEARITGQLVREGGAKVKVFYLMDFTDAQGLVHHIQANSRDTFIKGKDDDHVRIYYNPSNPINYELVNPGRYLLLLFLPFGLLIGYLGWPKT